MLNNSKKSVACVNRLVSRNLCYHDGKIKMISENPFLANKMFHTSSINSKPNYAAAAILPLPNNIDAAETTRFSPHRSRDISATVILSQYGASAHPTALAIDITADNTTSSVGSDPHVQSYDCNNTVSLNSAMQSNVPSPFGGMHKFSHLNMPGGQWSQEPKFMSQNLQSSHYTTLRDNARSGWVSYDENATIQKKVTLIPAASIEIATTPSTGVWNSIQQRRRYCTKPSSTSTAKVDQVTASVDADQQVQTLSKKEQLKKAFKDYGSTVIVFHVAISLASLGGFYALVSGGIDLMPALDYLGLASSALSQKIATGASTFVVAYAIHKVFAPIRISITLGATPFIVRYLRSKGFLKQKIIVKKT